MSKFFVFDSANNKIESMNKEQILTAITQAVESGTIKDIDTGFVSRLVEQNKNSNIKFWIGTTAEYNLIQEKINNCLYLLTDETTIDDVETDIEELKEKVKQLEEEVKNDLHDILSTDGVNFKISQGGLYLLMGEYTEGAYKEQVNLIINISKEQYNLTDIQGSAKASKFIENIEYQEHMMAQKVVAKFDPTTKIIIFTPELATSLTDFKAIKAKPLLLY